MPKRPRGIIAQDIKNSGLAVKDELIKAYKFGNPRQFMQEWRSVASIMSQVKSLSDDCDLHSRHAYVQNNKMRQVLMVAANDLETIRLELEVLHNQAAAAQTKEEMYKVIGAFTIQMLKLGRVEFQHDMRRTRPTLEDLERQAAEETSTAERAYSTLNNSQPEQKPGALGDAQLGSLNELFGG